MPALWYQSRAPIRTRAIGNPRVDLTSKKFIVKLALEKRLVVQHGGLIFFFLAARQAEARSPADAVPTLFVVFWGGHGSAVRLGGGRSGRRLNGTGLGRRRKVILGR